MSLITINANKDCKTCYHCIRVCQVKAIYLDSEKLPAMNSSRCIGCGDCVKVCPQEIVRFFDSKEETKRLLSSKNKVAAILAPSISAEFIDITDYRKLVKMVKALGFIYVNEVSFGVDLVAKKYADLFNNSKGKNYITSNCPVVISFIKKYQPELINNIAPIVSPMIATAKVIREKYGSNVKVVFIGPCIAAKEEAELYDYGGRVDSVLTFTELRELFAEFNISEKALEFADFNPPIGAKGSLFPISNGILQAADLSEDLLSGNIISTAGPNNFVRTIREFEESVVLLKRHLNLFYCEGCLMGPGTSRGGKKYLRKSAVIDFANKRLSNFDWPNWENSIQEFIGLDYSCSYSEDDQRIALPSEEKILEVLRIKGKEHVSDHSGCGACGFRSCREFAISVAQGLTHIDMCLPYLFSQHEKESKALEIVNNEYQKAQLALEEAEQQIKKEQRRSSDAVEVTNSFLEKLPSGVVIANEELKIVSANEAFTNILGEDAKEISEIIPGLVDADLKTLLPPQLYKLFSFVLTNNQNVLNRDTQIQDKLFTVSVFTIKANKMIGCIIRDLQVPEVRKEEIINRVTDVIDEQLALVQKIGFLLGEGASKTEKMLNSIINSYTVNPGIDDTD